jgi:cell division protein FtsB
VLLAVLPAFVIGAVVLSAIWGDNGLIRRLELREELERANVELRQTQRDNTRLLRELRLLEDDPIATERVIAEELEWATDGTTLYRFDEEPE